jgi:phenylalanyl-tRNA synthetase alpha chain
MDPRLQKIQDSLKADLAAQKPGDELRIKYLGRKSELSLFLRGLKDMPMAQRKALGDAANRLRQEIDRALSGQGRKAGSGPALDLDVTLPGKTAHLGSLHPITKVERELREIFNRMGFVAMEGPEVEIDHYNFETLNIPKGHPARDMHDTFYVDQSGFPAILQKNNYLLRTHISPMQVRVMEKHRPPLAVISSGRVFRHEATDARHEHTWDYMEGFMVGENVNLAHLQYTLDRALKEFFGPEARIMLRPSYFPFVEPGVEVAMSCVVCKGVGCKVCTTGWLEMLGAGMIHPAVFAAAGYPAGKYTGFAFGFGLSRFAMMKYKANDIRLFYRNDLRHFKN